MSSLFRDRIHRHDWILLRALVDDLTLGDVQHAVILSRSGKTIHKLLAAGGKEALEFAAAEIQIARNAVQGIQGRFPQRLAADQGARQ